MVVVKTNFGETNGQEVSLYKITNKNQTSISVLSYAATWQNFEVVEDGVKRSLIERFDNLNDYIKTPYEVGKTIGRVAGRITKAHFSINDVGYQLQPNDGANIIHSGDYGLQSQNFDSIVDSDNSVLFTHTVNGEDGFPGVLKVKIRYTLNDDDEVAITYSARTNHDTLFNPSCHVYFNLGESNIRQQQLRINSKHFLDMNAEKLPTGKMLAVTNAYDFKNFKKIGQGLKQLKPLDKFEFDDAYVVRDKAATLKSDKRAIDFYTDRNGLVIFTANPIDQQKASTHDYSSIAMELMTLPDAINHADFGETILNAGQKVSYTNKFKYRKLD
ncbi:aldose epimerase family protein [Companilactobacillus nantensis]|uniref:Aldose 1-epimerase n=1 Tax=Companilactobacillus nantensis DSM 16982 TaxID=1423774 RepID=A0A0R1WUH7_9LACO|nr:aldose epimerase family protein [Companilactobacillus nantensis]KRM18707.1 aldose 1-epimerase [Companilactobacillus nantensis DSM 16982]GEO63102.1 galactose mutarotase [Companilactobacillus nantensis]